MGPLRKIAALLIFLGYFVLVLVILLEIIVILGVFFDIILLKFAIGIWIIIGAAGLGIVFISMPVRFLKRHRIGQAPFMKKIEVVLFICGILGAYYAPGAAIDLYHDYHALPRPSSHYDARINDAFNVSAMGLIYQTIPGVPSAHCSSLLRLQNGDILCTWYAGTGEKHPDVAIYMARCTPSNETMELNWSTPVVIADTVNQSDGQPTLYQCPDGRVILFYQEMRNTGPLFETWGPVLKAGGGIVN